MRDGMALCKDFNLAPVIIESDSLLVVTVVRLGKMENWRLVYVFRECLVLYSTSFEIVHGFRQKNMVADRLADFSYLHKSDGSFIAWRISHSKHGVLISRIKMGLWTFRQ